MKKTLGALILMLAAGPAVASPALHVQGLVVDAQGRPYSGNAQIDFRIVDRIDPAEVWSEVHEVDVSRGVFLVTLGGRDRLPDPKLVQPSWKLKATPVAGSGLAVVDLAPPAQWQRIEQLGRLMAKLNGERAKPEPRTPPQYQDLLQPAAAAEEPAPFDPFARAPEPKPCAAAGAACPEELQKVLSSEQRLLQRRLSRLSREDAPRPGAYRAVFGR